MADISKLIQLINKAALNNKVKEEILNILNTVEQSGKSLNNEQIDKIISLLDLNIEVENIEADLLEDLALELENYATSIDNAADLLDSNLETQQKDFEEKLNKANVTIPADNLEE